MFTDWDLGEDYLCVKLLGKGAYGTVCLAKHIPSELQVAVKKMTDVFRNRVHAKRILREITLLRNLQNQSIIKILDVLEPISTKTTFSIVYVVMELADSDLKKLVESEVYLKMPQIKQVIYNLLCAVKYMHSSNVIHRDLKPANLLINKDCSVKICDFGLARSITGVESTASTLLMTPRRGDEDHWEDDDTDAS